jgi:hypothetical protein
MGESAFTAALSLFMGWLGSKLQDRLIRESLQKMEPEIRKRVKEQTFKAVDIVASGRKAYINTTIGVGQFTLKVSEPTGPHRASVPGGVSVWLSSVDVSDTPVAAGPWGHWQKESTNLLNEREVRDSDYYGVSTEWVFSQGELDLYRAFRDELDSYDEALKTPSLTAEDIQYLSVDRSNLDEELRETFEEGDADGPIQALAQIVQPRPLSPPKAPPAPNPGMLAPREYWGTTHVRSELQCGVTGEDHKLRCWETVPANARRVYVVAPGDGLGLIAQKFYGDPGKMGRIYSANSKTVGPPPQYMIHPGQALVIPE